MKAAGWNSSVKRLITCQEKKDAAAEAKDAGVLTKLQHGRSKGVVIVTHGHGSNDVGNEKRLVTVSVGRVNTNIGGAIASAEQKLYTMSGKRVPCLCIVEVSGMIYLTTDMGVVGNTKVKTPSKSVSARGCFSGQPPLALHTFRPRPFRYLFTDCLSTQSS